jgi:hypothetical protein
MPTAAIDRDPYDTPHRRDLLVDIQKGLLVPVLGGDINLCGRPLENGKGPISWEKEVDGTKSPPSTSELASHLLEQARQSKKLDPPMREVARVLVRQLRAHKDSMSAVGLANVCQYIKFVDPTILETGLPHILSEEYRPTPVHDFLVKLAQYQPNLAIPQDRPYPCIVTACFDHVLEQQLRKNNVPFHLLSFVLGDEGGFYRYTPPGELPEQHVQLSPSDVEKLTFQEHAVVIKLNGGIPTAARNFAITEDHYIDYLTHHGVRESLPKILLAKLTKRQNSSHLLFLGYSPRHWNLRLILLRIWSEYLNNKNKRWTVILEKGFSEIDTKFWKQYELLEERNLLQIDSPDSYDSYMNRLTERLATLPGRGSSQPCPSNESLRSPEKRDRDGVFISYSHKDSELFKELETMLAPVRERLKVWTDEMIRPGELWRQEIEKALASAKAAVLLVSPDFLASYFINTHELPQLLEAAKEKGLTILWIKVKEAMVHCTEIEKYQALYAADSLFSLTEEKRNQAIHDIAQKITDLLSEKA